MIDAEAVVRTYLLSKPGLTDYTGTRIFAGRHVPPVGYSLPRDGACVVFRTRGGAPAYDDGLVIPSVQFKCYGKSEAEAMQVYQALYDALHNGHSAQILHAEVETLGQSLEEPDTLWAFVLAYFTLLLRGA